MRGIRLTPDADHVLVGGLTRKGKTTFMRWLALEQLQPVRVIVVDPKGELSFPGVVPCRTPSEIAVRIRDPLCHYIPASFQREDLERAFQIIWETPGPLIIWVDEGAAVSNPSWCPEGLKLSVQQGSAQQKMVLIGTQRLAEIHPVFRSQSMHVVLFVPAPIELDLKTIAGSIHREASVLKAELESLHKEHGDYSHLWFVRDTNELRRCAPLPPAAVPGGPRRAAATPSSNGGQLPPCEDSVSASGPSSRSA